LIKAANSSSHCCRSMQGA